jgi:hypothetical protein
LKGQAMSQPAFQQFMNYSAGHGSDPSANEDSAATRIAADPDTIMISSRRAKVQTCLCMMSLLGYLHR